LRLENHIKEIHLFDKEYTTKRDTKTTENQDTDEWGGINGTCRVVTGNTFMEKLFFRKRVQKAAGRERDVNAELQNSSRCAR